MKTLPLPDCVHCCSTFDLTTEKQRRSIQQTSPSKQMAGLRTTVILIFLLSIGHSAALSPDELAQIILRIKIEYPIFGMFSLAVSIPHGDLNTLNQVFQDNPRQSVQAAISTGSVYKGSRLAVAKAEPPEHAELRVLRGLQLTSHTSDLLVIYCYASACPTTCTDLNSPYNIIKEIRNVINTGHWSDRVFVFEKIFWPQNSSGIKESKLVKALQNLGTSGISLTNIFRCYKPQRVNSAFKCTSCSNRGKVERQCIDYDA